MREKQAYHPTNQDVHQREGGGGPLFKKERENPSREKAFDCPRTVRCVTAAAARSSLVCHGFSINVRCTGGDRPRSSGTELFAAPCCLLTVHTAAKPSGLSPHTLTSSPLIPQLVEPQACGRREREREGGGPFSNTAPPPPDHRTCVTRYRDQSRLSGTSRSSIEAARHVDNTLPNQNIPAQTTPSFARW